MNFSIYLPLFSHCLSNDDNLLPRYGADQLSRFWLLLRRDLERFILKRDTTTTTTFDNADIEDGEFPLDLFDLILDCLSSQHLLHYLSPPEDKDIKSSLLHSEDQEKCVELLLFLFVDNFDIVGADVSDAFLSDILLRFNKSSRHSSTPFLSLVTVLRDCFEGDCGHEVRSEKLRRNLEMLSGRLDGLSSNGAEEKKSLLDNSVIESTLRLSLDNNNDDNEGEGGGGNLGRVEDPSKFKTVTDLSKTDLILLEFYLECPLALHSTPNARRSTERATVRALLSSSNNSDPSAGGHSSSWTDSQIEGWRVMFDRCVHKDKIIQEYLLFNYRERVSVGVRRGGQGGAPSSKNGASDRTGPSKPRGGGSNSSSRGGRGSGRGGSSQRKRGHDRKMQPHFNSSNF